MMHHVHWPWSGTNLSLISLDLPFLSLKNTEVRPKRIHLHQYTNKRDRRFLIFHKEQLGVCLPDAQPMLSELELFREVLAHSLVSIFGLVGMGEWG